MPALNRRFGSELVGAAETLDRSRRSAWSSLISPYEGGMETLLDYGILMRRIWRKL